MQRKRHFFLYGVTGNRKIHEVSPNPHESSKKTSLKRGNRETKKPAHAKGGHQMRELEQALFNLSPQFAIWILVSVHIEVSISGFNLLDEVLHCLALK